VDGDVDVDVDILYYYNDFPFSVFVAVGQGINIFFLTVIIMSNDTSAGNDVILFV